MTRDTTTALSNDRLDELARLGRWLVLSTVSGSKAGHVGGPLSAMDLLVTLFFDELRIRPHEVDWPGRDRFILSKGHSAIALYTVMALRGYFPVDELATFDKGDSRLQGHPDMTKLPGVETSTGSLGQGLAVGLGMAIGARRRGSDSHTWVMLGDGELQEGMIWESVHVAPRYGLGNLTAIVDYNGLQQYGWEPDGTRDRGDRGDPWRDVDLPATFESFGWRAIEFDGHDFDQIRSAFAEARAAGTSDRPTALVARTRKGRGLSFSEDRFAWHNGIADDDELALARTELRIDEIEGVRA